MLKIFSIFLTIGLCLVACTPATPVISILSTSGHGDISLKNQVLADGQIYINSFSNEVLANFHGPLSEIAVAESSNCDSASWTNLNSTIGINLSAGDGAKTISYRFRYKQVDFDCQKLGVIVDTTAPTLSAPTLSASRVTEGVETPTISWTAAIESGSGLKQYEVSLGTSSGGTQIKDWTSFNSNLSAKFTSLSLADGIYYLNLRAKDKVNNVSSVQTVSFLKGFWAAPGLSIEAPNKSPSNIISPTLIASGVATGDLVSIYSDSTCTNFIASGTAAATSLAITVPTLGADGSFSYSAKYERDGRPSTCSAGLTYVLDTIAPTLSFTGPTTVLGNSSTTFDWSVSYIGADKITLGASDISFIGASSGCVASVSTVSTVSTSERNISVTGCTASGSLRLNIAANSASDNAGNQALAATSADSVTVDNTAPTIIIRQASPTIGNANSIFIWPVTYSGASVINLTSANIQLTGTATVDCSVAVGDGLTLDSKNVIVSGCTGDGSLGFSISQGTASDNLGNQSASSVANSVTLDQTVYKVQIANTSDEVVEGNATNDQGISLSITPAPANPITVNFKMNADLSTATSTDFNLNSGSVDFAANTTATSINYQYFGDTSINNSKIISLNISSLTGIANVELDSNTYFQRLVKDDDGGFDSFAQVESGGAHACGITAGQVLKCWGSNSFGQLGNGTITSSSSPVVIDSGVPYKQVSAGKGHSCGITSSGSLKCWGDNTSGQIGNGQIATIPVTTPTVIDALVLYDQIAVGDAHTCGVTTTQVLKCWGSNLTGQLGIVPVTGTALPNQSLLPVKIDSGVQYLQISAGGSHTCALTMNNVLKCWGLNSSGQIGNNSTTPVTSPTVVDPSVFYSQITAGSTHTCGITVDNILNCWGGNSVGQLGDGSTNTSLVPVQIDPNVTYSKIAAGNSYTCGITLGNNLKCWGVNSYGQIGNGFTDSTGVKLPTAIDSVSSYNQITAGDSHTCGLTAAGVLKCWGDNSSGQLGNGTITNPSLPIPIDSGTVYSQIMAGSNHTCGLISGGGALKCWGANSGGQIGNFKSIDTFSPFLIDAGTSYSQVAGGNSQSCGITSSGVLKCWGPIPEVIDSALSYKQISAGYNHTCGITNSGDLKCWGLNSTGQLGDGTTTDSPTPIDIDLGVKYLQVSAGSINDLGGSQTCAITTAHVLKCWGANNWGQLGNNSTIDSLFPTVIDPGTSYSQISVGYIHTCGITTNSVLKCWGNNSSGQLGDGTNTNSSSPIVIDNSLNYLQIAVGLAHTCGITSTHILKCWGNGSYGQLGNGGYTQTVNSPVEIDSSTSFAQVTAGQNHSCALTSSGSLKCWGKNDHGQLGIGQVYLPYLVIY